MNANQAKPMSAEDVRGCVQALLKDPAFEGLYGKLGGESLYRRFIAVAEERQRGPEAIDGHVYAFRTGIARRLRDYEANRVRLEHSTDAESATRARDDGSLEVLAGGGAIAGGHTIHIPFDGENLVTYGNSH